MPSEHLSKTFRTFTYSGNAFSPENTALLVEVPLEIIINHQRHILIMFTPEFVRELVVGFVFTEGLISNLSDIEQCAVSPVHNTDGGEIFKANVTTSLHPADPISNQTVTRISYSSCGICGKENYYDLSRGLSRVKSRHRFSMEVLRKLPHKLKKLQPLYRNTGGAHAALLFDPKGEAIFHCEDMGRHNALDKVIGLTLIEAIPSDDKIVVSSGRASLEMILKTARIGFPVFVAMSRPTSRAVEAAKFYNITLIDMARGSSHIYTHVRRIQGF